MSEYQYYEFRAIDRPLDRDAMDDLRDISSRAEITSTSFTNTYNYGDFKGDPAQLMDLYFDAFVYVANWGTHQLMFRIPRSLFDAVAAKAYCDEEVVSLKATKKHVVLEFSSRDEEPPDDWVEGEPWMSSLIGLRAELMRGDWRALYLGWLASVASDYDGWDGDEGEDGDEDAGREDEGLREPPVPPGLAKLSGAQKALAEFLRIDDALIEAAAAASVGDAPAEPSRDDLAKWIKGIPAADKDAYLLRFLAEDGDIPLRAEMTKQFRDDTAPAGAARPSGAERRTVSQLLAARDAIAEEKKRKSAEKAARDRARREKEQADARSKHLDALALREPKAWKQAEDLIATKKSKDYDEAVALLVDLRDLAARSGRAAEAESRIRDLRRLHANKPSLIRRLDEKKLGT
jgi:hypothetical protein